MILRDKSPGPGDSPYSQIPDINTSTATAQSSDEQAAWCVSGLAVETLNGRANHIASA